MGEHITFALWQRPKVVIGLDAEDLKIYYMRDAVCFPGCRCPVVAFRCTCSCRVPNSGYMASNSIYAISNRHRDIYYIYFPPKEQRSQRATCSQDDDPLRFSISQFLSPCAFFFSLSAFLPGAISVISSIDFIATLLANIKNLSIYRFLFWALPSRTLKGKRLGHLNICRLSQVFLSLPFWKCVCLRASRRRHRCIILWQTPSPRLAFAFPPTPRSALVTYAKGRCAALSRAQAAVVTRQTQLISAWKNVWGAYRATLFRLFRPFPRFLFLFHFACAKRKTSKRKSAGKLEKSTGECPTSREEIK